MGLPEREGQDNATSTEGLDGFFATDVASIADTVEVSDDSDTTSDDKQTTFDATPDDVATVADTIEWMSVGKAAVRLNKSERTIQRYAKSNKVISKFDASGKLVIGLSSDADIHPTSRDKTTTTADNKSGETTSHDNDATRQIYDDIFADYRTQVKDLQTRLEGASFQLGRTTLLLEQQQEELKLLPDYQSKKAQAESYASTLESELEQLKRVLEEKDSELLKYKELDERSSWRKFCDWWLGK